MTKRQAKAYACFILSKRASAEANCVDDPDIKTNEDLQRVMDAFRDLSEELNRRSANSPS